MMFKQKGHNFLVLGDREQGKWDKNLLLVILHGKKEQISDYQNM